LCFFSMKKLVIGFENMPKYILYLLNYFQIYLMLNWFIRNMDIPKKKKNLNIILICESFKNLKKGLVTFLRWFIIAWFDPHNIWYSFDLGGSFPPPTKVVATITTLFIHSWNSSRLYFNGTILCHYFPSLLIFS